MYMYICVCDIYACTHQCLCIQKVCATYICSIYFAYRFWFGVFFLFKPLISFFHSSWLWHPHFCFQGSRDQFWKIHAEYKMHFWEERKEEKQHYKSKLPPPLVPMSPSKRGGEWNVPQRTRLSCTNVMRQCQAYHRLQNFPSGAMHTHTHANSQKRMSECQLILWLQLSQALTWMHPISEVWRARRQFVELCFSTRSALLQRFVNQATWCEKVTLLSGWLSVLRRTVREEAVTTPPPLSLFADTGGSCSTYAAI